MPNKEISAISRNKQQRENHRRRIIFYHKRGGCYPKSAFETLPQFHSTHSSSSNIRERLGPKINIRERLGSVQLPIHTSSETSHSSNYNRHHFSNLNYIPSKVSTLCVNSIITQSKLNIKICEQLSSLETSIHNLHSQFKNGARITRNNSLSNNSSNMDHADDDQVGSNDD